MEFRVGDQADGLRRIFGGTRPRVLAVVPCGVVTISWVASALLARSGMQAGVRTLVLDEGERCGNLGDCLGLVPRYSLLEAAVGEVALPGCVCQGADGLALARAGELARQFGEDRIITQRGLQLLHALQGGFDEWLVMAHFDPLAEGFSPLVTNAADVLLVLDGRPKSATEAWAALGRLKKWRAGIRFAVCATGRDAEARAALAAFRTLAKLRLGVEVSVAGALDEAFPGVERQKTGVLTDSFMDRLVQTGRGDGKVCREPAFRASRQPMG